MDFSSLLDPIAVYIDAAVAFFALRTDPYLPLVGAGSVSTRALSIFFTGMVIAAVVARGHGKGLFVPPTSDPRRRSKEEKLDVLMMLLPLFSTVALVPIFHIAIAVTSLWSDTGWGPIADTINVSLVTSGVLAPLNGLLSQVAAIDARRQHAGLARDRVVVTTRTLGTLATLSFYFYALRHVALVHAVPVVAVLVPLAISLVLVLPLFCLLGRLAIARIEAEEATGARAATRHADAECETEVAKAA